MRDRLCTLDVLDVVPGRSWLVVAGSGDIHGSVNPDGTKAGNPDMLMNFFDAGSSIYTGDIGFYRRHREIIYQE